MGAYLGSSALAVAGQRTHWLAIFLVGLLCCASVMSRFERLLERELELAFFVPLLIGHGGNSGGQAVSTVIRALGSKKVRLSDAPRVILKEAAAGALQSLACALILAPSLRYGMGTSERVVAVVAMTMPVLGLFANTLGAALPFVVMWVGQDPAVIVGPLTTTSVDTIGLTIYLTIATRFLGLGSG